MKIITTLTLTIITGGNRSPGRHSGQPRRPSAGDVSRPVGEQLRRGCRAWRCGWSKQCGRGAGRGAPGGRRECVRHGSRRRKHVSVGSVSSLFVAATSRHLSSSSFLSRRRGVIISRSSLDVLLVGQVRVVL